MSEEFNGFRREDFGYNPDFEPKVDQRSLEERIAAGNPDAELLAEAERLFGADGYVARSTARDAIVGWGEEMGVPLPELDTPPIPPTSTVITRRGVVRLPEDLIIAAVRNMNEIPLPDADALKAGHKKLNDARKANLTDIFEGES